MAFLTLVHLASTVGKRMSLHFEFVLLRYGIFNTVAIDKLEALDWIGLDLLAGIVFPRLKEKFYVRNVLGTKTLGDILSDRESIALEMQTVLDEGTEPWGVKVERVEVTMIITGWTAIIVMTQSYLAPSTPLM